MSEVRWSEEKIFAHNYKQGFWLTRQCLTPEFDNHTKESDICDANMHITVRHLQYLELVNSLALIQTEIAEAIEGVRKNPDWKLNTSEHVPALSNLEEELADAVIRIRDLCGGLNIDLEECINLKMEYNTTRPYKHGKHA